MKIDYIGLAVIAAAVGAAMFLAMWYVLRPWMKKELRNWLDSYSCRDETNAFWQMRRDLINNSREFFKVYSKGKEELEASWMVEGHSLPRSFDSQVLERMGFSEESWKKRKDGIYKEPVPCIAFFTFYQHSLERLNEQYALLKLAKEIDIA